MTYAELVTRLRKRAKELPERFSKNEENIRLFLAAADAIEELNREYESIAASLTESVELVRKLQSPRWISVTERLPEDYVPVLTCDDRGNIHMFEHYSGYKHPFNIGPYHPRFYPVMFWMELPKPPTEVKT